MWLMYDFLHFTVFVTESFPQQLSHGTANIILYIVYLYHVEIHPAEMCHRIYLTAAYNYHPKKAIWQCILLEPGSQKITFKTLFVCVHNAFNLETMTQQKLLFASQ